MAQVPLDEVFVLALWVSTFLFGFQALLYIVALWVLVNRRAPNNPVNLPMVTTATAMLVLAALYNFVCLDRIVDAFWKHVDHVPTLYFSDVDQPVKFAEASIWILQALVGDSFLTFRCWVVWDRRWKAIIIPIMFLLTTFGLGIWLEFKYSGVPLQAENPQLTARLLGWEAALVAMTFFQNILITGLIAFRIWWRHRQLTRAIPSPRSATYWHAIWLIVESGMVVAFSHGVLGVTAVLKSSAYEIVIQAIPFIIGCSFTGIIVRVQLRKKPWSVYASDMPGHSRSDGPSSGQTHTLPPIHFAVAPMTSTGEEGTTTGTGSTPTRDGAALCQKTVPPGFGEDEKI